MSSAVPFYTEDRHILITHTSNVTLSTELFFLPLYFLTVVNYLFLECSLASISKDYLKYSKLKALGLEADAFD